MRDEIVESLRKIEAELIDQREKKSLGHRIVYDIKTGKGLNISGDCDPDKLDEYGYQVRL